jgi:hypothetical protein
MKRVLGFILFIFGISLTVFSQNIEVETTSITLSENYISSEKSVLNPFVLAKVFGDHILIGIDGANGATVFELNSNLELVGQYDYPGFEIDFILPLGRDRVLLLLGSEEVVPGHIEGYTDQLNAMILNRNMRMQSLTKIFGGDFGAGESWYDGRSNAVASFNGQEIGIFLEVQKDWSNDSSYEDIHNGDAFYVLDLEGRLIENRDYFWTASHSSTIKVASELGGDFYTLTVVDAPSGLQLYNRNTDERTIIWPDPEYRFPYEEVNSTNPNGVLEEMFMDNGDIISIMASIDHLNVGVFDKLDVLFLRHDAQGREEERRWLTRTEDDESKIIVEQLGNRLFFLWGAGNSYDDNWVALNATFAITDLQGRFIQRPVELNAPLGTYSDAVILDTQLVWFYMDSYTREIEAYSIQIP